MLRVPDALQRQVDVQSRPVKMVWLWPLNRENRLQRGSLEPGELGKWNKKLFLP